MSEIDKCGLGFVNFDFPVIEPIREKESR